MTITTATNNVVKGVKELKDYFISEAMKSDMFTNMESNEMEMIWKMFRMLDYSTTLMVEQAKVMDDMAFKINELLERSNKGEA